jgi:hypothetical protein
MTVGTLLFERAMCRAYLNMVIAMGKTKNRSRVEAKKDHNKK